MHLISKTNTVTSHVFKLFGKGCYFPFCMASFKKPVVEHSGRECPHGLCKLFT